ncbi:hypothetical protein CH252_31085 [Rhodococcus sp. 06-1477-1B]|nr:hypothetical protein CH252_31085 [Rhodococcus sp. 06-1477-1B]
MFPQVELDRRMARIQFPTARTNARITPTTDARSQPPPVLEISLHRSDTAKMVAAIVEARANPAPAPM